MAMLSKAIIGPGFFKEKLQMYIAKKKRERENEEEIYIKRDLPDKILTLFRS